MRHQYINILGLQFHMAVSLAYYCNSRRVKGQIFHRFLVRIRSRWFPRKNPMMVCKKF
uniref:Uncharacterized protein n=1 Tax=Parascaris univalens TaxID=6257 RepID=A0A915CHY9_PARUN